jgi:hypothetical protein
MSNTRKFSDFDSPDSGTEVGTNEAGVLLTDTLEDLREKTNGIIEKVKDIDAGEITVNVLEVNKIVQIAGNRLLGNVSGVTANVTEIEIDVTASGLQDSDDAIPTSKAVKDYVDNKVSTDVDAAVTTYDDNSGRIHFIDVFADSVHPNYGVNGYTNLRAGPSTANVAYVASLMTNVVKAGHFVLARYRQHARYGGGNGTGHHNIQLLVMFKVASVDGSTGIPTLTHHNDGYNGL